MYSDPSHLEDEPNVDDILANGKFLVERFNLILTTPLFFYIYHYIHTMYKQYNLEPDIFDLESSFFLHFTNEQSCFT